MLRYRFDQLLLVTGGCNKIEEEGAEKRSKSEEESEIDAGFLITTAAVASLTILPVLMECTVYHAIVPSHYMPHTIVIIVLCRDIWCKIKVDEGK